MLRTGDYNHVKRHFVSVPSYRHYLRNTRPSKTRLSFEQAESMWQSQPSCRMFIVSVATVLCITFMLWMSDVPSSYYRYIWRARMHDDDSSSQYTAMATQQAVDLWLAKYPLVEPHIAFAEFTCDAWRCVPTYDANRHQWNEPRVEYQSKPRSAWMQRHLQQNQVLLEAQQTCEWILIGDSITYAWQAYHGPSFDKYFKHNNAVVYAQSGDKIHEVGWRLNDQQGRGFDHMRRCLTSHKMPHKRMVLLIGTNDIGSGSSLQNGVVLDMTYLLQQLFAFVEQVNQQQQTVTLYVMAIFPRSRVWIPMSERKQNPDKQSPQESWNVDNPYFFGINFVNDYLKQYVEQHAINDHVKFVDCNGRLLKVEHDADKNMVQFKDTSNVAHEYQTGLMTVEKMDDLLHLTDRGYQEWAQCIL